MSFNTLICRQEEGVGIIKIDVPHKDPEQIEYLANELSDVAHKITSDTEIRVIVLASTTDSAFSMNECFIPKMLMAENELEKKFFSLAESITRLDQPVVAAINGDALGQGLELALACDLRICSDSAHFAMNHLIYGAIPWNGGTPRLSRVVGRGKAMEMILTGETINAQEAHRIGLVHKLVPEAELLTAAMDMAREMASKGQLAPRYAKEAINKGVDLTLEQGLRLEADLYFLLHTTRDRTEGIKAFREKRTPEFEGR